MGESLIELWHVAKKAKVDYQPHSRPTWKVDYAFGEQIYYLDYQDHTHMNEAMMRYFVDAYNDLFNASLTVKDYLKDDRIDNFIEEYLEETK